MYLHFDKNVLVADLKDVIDGFAKGILGHDKHQSLARRLRDTNDHSRTQARFAVVANCIDCGESVVRALTTIWQRGAPVEFSLEDRSECPQCRGKKGFHFSTTKSFHA